MKKYQIIKQTLNTGSLDIIELYLKGKETNLNPEIDQSETIAMFDSEQEAWRALENYNSVIRPDCRKYHPHNAEEALKSIIDEGRGDHRLEEYILEVVTCDEDGEASDYNFLDRAEFKNLMIYQLQEITAEAPKKKADWHNGMVQDADSAHVVKNLEVLDWFLSKQQAMETLNRYSSYVDEYGKAYEYQIEEIIIGDLDDDSTMKWGDTYLSDYPYIKIYIQDNRHIDYLFEDYFNDIEEADNYIDDDWIEEHLHDDDIAIHYLSMDNKEIKVQKIKKIKDQKTLIDTKNILNEVDNNVYQAEFVVANKNGTRYAVYECDWNGEYYKATECQSDGTLIKENTVRLYPIDTEVEEDVFERIGYALSPL